jgi:Tfp pilus assembly protein PilX
MKAADEKGVALIMVLILMGVLSVLAASLVFVSQSETWSSQNYRLMTEARYGAESGVHKAANFILSSYSPPGTAGDPMSAYTITQSPVQSGGQAVQLTSTGSGSNYPVSSVVTAFANFVHGTLTSGTDPVTYDATAKLISMRQVDVYGSVLPVTVQTWSIVGRGTIGGNKPAYVEVKATLERQVEPMFSYAAFATSNGCGALSWSGGGTTDSYDSSAALIGGVPVDSMFGGNVGTNGNLDENGGPTIIHGSLSTPRTGVGSCSTGAVTALTLSGSSAPTAGLVELPQPVTYPPPTVPNPPPTGNLDVPKTGSGSNIVKSPTTNPCPGNPSQACFGDITIKGALHLTVGTYNINSLTVNANADGLVVDSGPVIINVAGYSTAGVKTSGSMGTPIDLTGQGLITVPGFDASMLQFTYAGAGTIKMAGGVDGVGVLYAPNATVTNNSAGAAWYGAVIAKTVTDAGHAVIHYDRRLSADGMVVGPWMIDSFSWRKF